jgi:hypothetical protein
MIAVVRPFSIKYEGNWFPVLYIAEGDGTVYCVAGKDETQLFIESKKVTGIRATHEPRRD